MENERSLPGVTLARVRSVRGGAARQGPGFVHSLALLVAALVGCSQTNRSSSEDTTSALPQVDAHSTLEQGGPPCTLQPPDPPCDPPHPDAATQPMCSGAWCWRLPFPQGNTLRAVWAAGPDSLWAAGDGGTLLHSDGRTWTRVEAPTGGDLVTLHGSGSCDVWAGGELGLFHWDGRRWSADEGGFLKVRGVWTTGPCAAWVSAIRLDGPSLGHWGVFRWDGGSWKELAPLPAGISEPSATWAACSQDVWTIGRDPSGSMGSSVVARYDGDTWTLHRLPDSADLGDLWGDGQGNVWVAGRSVKGMLSLWRWNGESWSVHPSEVPGFAHSLHGASSDDLWVAGSTGLVHFERQEFVPVSGYSGGKPQGSGGTGSALLDLWMLAEGRGLAVGVNGMTATCEKSTWASSRPDDTLSILAVDGTGPGDVWVAGAGTGEETGSSPVLRWNGSGWEAMPPAPLDVVAALATPESGHVVTAGRRGQWAAIAQWNGSEWISAPEIPKPAPNAYSARYSGLWTCSPTDLWAVGDWGLDGPKPEDRRHLPLVTRFDGAKWAVLEDVPATVVQAVWGSGPDDVWLVGEGPRIVHWNGSTWNTVEPEGSDPFHLTTVWGTSKSDAWAFGNGLGQKLALHWNGAAWKPVEFPGISGSVSAVWGDAPNHYLATANGLYEGHNPLRCLRFDGSAWSPEGCPATDLRAVRGIPGAGIWAVGQGAVLSFDP